MERWRKVERPLDHEQRILKVWKTWGETIQEVRFTLRRIKAEAPDASDSDTGSRVERIRRRHKWKQQQQQQQRQSEGNNRTSSEQRNSSNAGVAAFTSSSSASQRKHNGEDTKMNETMERLMRLVVAQGETIQTQLRRMQERDQQIENFEHQLHLFRVQNLGSDYLLQSYLKDPVGDSPQNTLHGEASAFVKEEEKSNDSGVVTEELCDNDIRPSHLEKPLNKSQQSSISFEELEDIRNRTILLDKLDKVLERLLEHEEAQLKLENSLTESAACELAMLEEEIATAVSVHANTVANARQNEQKLRELDIVLYNRRMTLDSLLEEDAKYEREALALQAHLDYIIHLPPTAFKLPEETGQLITHLSSEVSIKSLHESSSLKSAEDTSHSNPLSSDMLKTNAVPIIVTPETKIYNPKNEVSKDVLIVKPNITQNKKMLSQSSSTTEAPPPLPATSPPPLEVDEEDDKDSAKTGSLCVSSRSSTSSDSSRTGASNDVSISKGISSKPSPSGNSKDVDTTDSNSDTGLSSLHSSSDEGAYVFDTLV
ncbi:Ras association domain-containing protein 10 [Armadillidium vulgare]|nr:Ras association domain-containing protein 10 [Armadillidium vulgare]